VGRVLERRGVLIAVFVLHIAITLWTALHHEVWADEGDPWLLMRDADAVSMFRAASGRGVPLLFESTVWPFARLGAPYLAQQLINLVYVWLAVALMLRSRAFPPVVRILFAFSYYPAFEYAAIPRPYGLQMLLTFAVAEAWFNRRAHPLRLAVFVALLANTTVLGLITAAVAGAILLWERIGWRPVLVMLLGGLASVAQLWPREQAQDVYSIVQLDTVWYALASMFFPDVRVGDAVGPAVIVLGLIVYGISRHWQPVAFLLAAGTGVMLVYVFIWMGGLRHAGLLTMIVIAAIWITDAYGPYRRERLMMAALAVALAYSILPAYRSWVDETRYAFSGSREFAEYVRESGLDRNVVLVAHSPFWTSPLVYLPGVKIWYPASGAYGTFARWERKDYDLSRVPLDTVLRQADVQLRGRRWVLLTHRELPENQRDRFRLLFKSRVRIWRMRAERYRVYEPVRSP
jgi:hypothetical protein